MIQIGRYEELGSGVRKVNHYLPHYTPGAGNPLFEDGDMFKVVVPLVAAKTPEVTAQPESGPESGPESMAVRILMILSETCRSKSEIADALGHTSISSKLNLRVNELLVAGLIEWTIPDKPTSRLQKYRLTDKGRAAFLQAKTEVGK